MNWLNLRTEILHSPEFIGSDPTARGTWCAMMLWCAQQENGGAVAGAEHWSDRQWQQTCGVTRQEIDAAGKLLTWDNGYLRVFAYPSEQEAAFVKMAVGGRNGGLRRALNIHAKKADSVAPLQAPLQAEVEAPAEAKGREGKEKEGKENTEGAELLPDSESYSLPFQSPAFVTAWAQWKQHRTEIRKPLKPTATKAQLAKLAAMGELRAIAAINHSLANQWTGIFEPDANRNTPTNGHPRQSTGFRHTNIACSDYRGVSD